MNEHEKNFLILLDRAVHKNSVPLTEPISYSEILRLSEEHNLLSLVFNELCRCEGFKTSPEYNTFKSKATALVMAQINRTNCFSALYAALAEKGLYPIVLKGIVCRSMYGELCDYRPSGDEDLLIRESELKAVREVLEEQGYFTNENFSDRDMKKLDEISFWGRNTHLHIELHLTPMGDGNSLRSQMNTYFVNVFENYMELNINNLTIRTPDYTHHFLYLVLHSFKHFAAGGLGIRQVLDTLLFYEKFGSEIDWSYVKNALAEVRAEAFFADMIYLGNKYIGFDLPSLPSVNCPEELAEDILHCGAFGNGTQVYRSAQPFVSAAVRSRSSGSLGKKIKTAAEVIFPGKKKLIKKYPQISAKPWLIVPIWFKRWGRFIRHNGENGGNLAQESLKLGRKRIELLKKYDILK